jgi:hypothetical protein
LINEALQQVLEAEMEFEYLHPKPCLAIRGFRSSFFPTRLTNVRP